MTEAALVEGQVKLRDGKKGPGGARQGPAGAQQPDAGGHLRPGARPGLRGPGPHAGHPVPVTGHHAGLRQPRGHVRLGRPHPPRPGRGFPVTVAPGTKLESGPATLHLCNDLLVVARDVPPAVAGQWKLSDLRRYGAVPNGFILEGGTRCGYWAGVFFLSSTEGERISFLFDCIVRGISPSKGPAGLRPLLPDAGAGGAAAAEERVALEALEALQLEKRLSLLSHCGRPGSGGDDRSLSSSSSEASHSDVSAGSRLAAWPEQSSSSSASASQEGPGLAAPALGEAAPGAPRPPPRPPRPRQLQELGRQGSSDSGIATGSHSSYSGSCSSCAGSSLDVWRAGEELGSQLSLPPGAEPRLCACAPAAEYQVPGAPRPHYDTPRSLRPAPRAPGGPPPSPAPREPWEAGGLRAGPPPAVFAPCAACGGLKVKPPP
ncbi:protein Dok-7 isoform X4 [Pipistrellus kuhlii]|uniref:protein Dok-7 isoform X4 n=1 Tax=Pipistrellus kuhlii TaxID=59472 RepID=UPI00174F0243|nr:protein Dok-7 isoform X4 [Pipistrellus kuhlii]